MHFARLDIGTLRSFMLPPPSISVSHTPTTVVYDKVRKLKEKMCYNSIIYLKEIKISNAASHSTNERRMFREKLVLEPPISGISES